MNESFKKVEELLRTKNYSDLSEVEKTLIEEQIGGEINFRELKLFHQNITHDANKPVSKYVKSNLMAKMKVSRPSLISKLFQYQLPAYQAFSLVVLLVLVVWIFRPERELIVETIKLPPQIDTLRIQLPSDTIFLEKIVKVEVEVPVYIERELAPKVRPEVSVVKGSSMAEKPDLQDLLVRSL